MASASKRQQRPFCSPSATLCTLAIVASFGALVRCQSGGFGSPSPAAGQCDAAGPRQECGAFTDRLFHFIAFDFMCLALSAVLVRGTGDAVPSPI